MNNLQNTTHLNSRVKRKTLGQRIKDHLFFSVVVMTAIFVVLSLIGIKARFASLLLSILITLALNVGLSYFYEHRANKNFEAQPVRDADIRFKN